MLKLFETGQNVCSDTFGKDCHAANLLYGISKMRYAQGKGDPSGFKFFLRQNGLKAGVILRYVGNRFHVIFHLAGVVFNLCDKLCLYLETICHNKPSLRSALLKDLRNPLLHSQGPG